jgi:hypothetical protein
MCISRASERARERAREEGGRDRERGMEGERSNLFPTSATLSIDFIITPLIPLLFSGLTLTLIYFPLV